MVLPADRRQLLRRLVQLYAGLALYGVSMALLVQSSLGVMPWDVLHQGIARRTGLSLGTVTVLVALVVLLAWVPLRQRPGLGTVSNVVVIGVAVDAALAVLPAPSATAVRLAYGAAGILLNAVATAAYIGVDLGPGPRDGLMTGLVRRTGLSLGTVTVLVALVVLLAWVPLRQRPGLGTVSNVVVIGLAVDAALAVLPAPSATAAQLSYGAAGVLLNAVATAAYIGVDLGPGPRDGLMTGLVRRTGRSVRLVRTSIEVAVVATGWALGGRLGLLTVVYALSIGPLVHALLPRLQVVSADRSAPVGAGAGRAVGSSG